jgi:hypothetical protein
MEAGSELFADSGPEVVIGKDGVEQWDGAPLGSGVEG